MTFLNPNPFLIITQAELCLKGTFVKASFVCYNFFRCLWNPRWKNFINPSCPKHRKIINWNKKWHNFYFQASLWCIRKVWFICGTKKNSENKKFVFLPLILLGQQGLRLYFVKLLTYNTSISLKTEIHKNNIDTFRVTNKQYHKIILS